MRVALLCRLRLGQEPAPRGHISEPSVVRLREGPDQGAGFEGIGIVAGLKVMFFLGVGMGVFKVWVSVSYSGFGK